MYKVQSLDFQNQRSLIQSLMPSSASVKKENVLRSSRAFRRERARYKAGGNEKVSQSDNDVVSRDRVARWRSENTGRGI